MNTSYLTFKEALLRRLGTPRACCIANVLSGVRVSSRSIPYPASVNVPIAGVVGLGERTTPNKVALSTLDWEITMVYVSLSVDSPVDSWGLPGPDLFSAHVIIVVFCQTHGL